MQLRIFKHFTLNVWARNSTRESSVRHQGQPVPEAELSTPEDPVTYEVRHDEFSSVKMKKGRQTHFGALEGAKNGWHMMSTTFMMKINEVQPSHLNTVLTSQVSVMKAQVQNPR
jgi:hypothetical protein